MAASATVSGGGPQSVHSPRPMVDAVDLFSMAPFVTESPRWRPLCIDTVTAFRWRVCPGDGHQTDAEWRGKPSRSKVAASVQCGFTQSAASWHAVMDRRVAWCHRTDKEVP